MIHTTCPKMDSSILFICDDVDVLIHLNLTGPIELTGLLLPGMLQRKQEHITSLDKGN
jgi:NADP-dependent 3-hydroxy acid dehydrogenase YdfG